MYNIEVSNANEAFVRLFSYVKDCGQKVGDTRACFDVGVQILNPADRLIICPWRKWSKVYAEREWAWYLSKNRSVVELKKYAPIWDTMHSGDNIVNSNYGWQWSRNEQLLKCIEQLRNNKNTRQAWVTIYDGKEKDSYEFDTPCTLSVGFSVVDNRLNISVLMRSNDLVYGFCNDQYCFSKLQELVASELDLKMGTYFHYAHNMHIYENKLNLKNEFDRHN